MKSKLVLDVSYRVRVAPSGESYGASVNILETVCKTQVEELLQQTNDCKLLLWPKELHHFLWSLVLIDSSRSFTCLSIVFVLLN